MTTPEHRPAPAPIAENTVLAETATVEQAEADYADHNGGAPEHPSSYGATPHTHGRQS